MHNAIWGEPSRNPLEECLEDGLSHVRLIVTRMRRRLPGHVDPDDLMGDGLLGLAEAARQYDPRRKVTFRTFAEHRIRGAITDGLRRLDPLPRTVRQRQRVAEHAVASLTGGLGRFPSEQEVAAQLGLSIDEWRRINRQFTDAGCPVDGLGFAPPHIPRVEDLPAGQSDPERFVQRRELRRVLREAVRDLPLRCRRVIALYYGHEWTIGQIGNSLGMSESRTSQIHRAALGRLRNSLTTDGYDARKLLG